MTRLRDTAKQLLIMAVEGKQGVQGSQEIVRDTIHPTCWNKQLTITAGGDPFYEEKPNTEQQSSQASAAIDELHAAGLIQVVSESPDKKRQRFHVTLKGLAVYDKLKNPPRWVGRREE